jgi:hypothetical protein
MNAQLALPERPWSHTKMEVADRLGVDPSRGLSLDERGRRLDRFGANAIDQAPPKSAAPIFIAQLRGLIVGLLGAAALRSFVFGEYLEGISVLVVLLRNGIIGFVTELTARRSMEALEKLGHVEAGSAGGEGGGRFRRCDRSGRPRPPRGGRHGPGRSPPRQMLASPGERVDPHGESAPVDKDPGRLGPQ